MFVFGKFVETEILQLYFAKYFSWWQILIKNLGQQYGDGERETEPPEETEGLEDGDGCEGQYEGAGEEVAPELAPGEEEDEVGEEEDLTNGWEELSVLTDGITTHPVESQPIDQAHQLGQQSPQLEPVHSLLPVDPGDLGQLGEEGGGHHEVTQEGRELGDHHSITAPLRHWAGGQSAILTGAVPYITGKLGPHWTEGIILTTKQH